MKFPTSDTVKKAFAPSVRKGLNLFCILVCTCLVSVSVLTGGDGADHTHSEEGRKVVDKGGFKYDQPDKTLPATQLDNPRRYDADVSVAPNGVWMTWLEYKPGEGDVLLLGKRSGGEAVSPRRKIVESPSRLAHPTLTRDASGTLWLTFEEMDPEREQWLITVVKGVRGKTGEDRWTIDRPGQNDINHSVAADPEQGIHVTWQCANDGQFDVFARHVTGSGPNSLKKPISPSAGGDWMPDITAGEDGTVTVAWEHYDGDGFDLLYRQRADGQWNRTGVLAETDGFERSVSLASGTGGKTWAIWEEGATNWGKPFRGDPNGWNNIKDAYGPLHRYRKLHMAVISPDGTAGELQSSVPTPMLKRARERDNARSGVELLGAYYERAMVEVDDRGRPWVFYRHFYNPQVGLKENTKHHREKGWKCYARCLTDQGWSPLFALPAHQRDGMQRLSVDVNRGRLAASWTSGRTDRKDHPNTFNGLSVTNVQTDDRVHGEAPAKSLVENSRRETVSENKSRTTETETEIQVDGESYSLVFGDLHRHTDLSLCFPFYDGSIEETFRYGIEEADLDFLGITDHTRDIDQGDHKSLLWWRSVKEDTRYRIPEQFMTFYSYERSRGGADHNVISLREDMLRPHTSPLPNFWKKINDRKTFTIPHNPINPGNVWTMRPEHSYKRPLAEVYQGFRDQSSRSQIEAGLQKNHHVGLIASSDHMSTHVSYACIWTPENSREGIFQSMIDRRAYGATDRIKLVFRSGTHLMGERFSASGVPPFHISVKGTAPIKSMVLFRNGDPVDKRTFDEGNRRTSLNITRKPENKDLGEKENYFYVRVTQSDGNKAWSSPIWIKPDNSN